MIRPKSAWVEALPSAPCVEEQVVREYRNPSLECDIDFLVDWWHATDMVEISPLLEVRVNGRQVG